MFDNAFTNALQGLGRAHYEADPEEVALYKQFNMPVEELTKNIDGVYPNSEWVPLTGSHGVVSNFAATHKPQAVIVVKGAQGEGDSYTQTGPHMSKFIKAHVPGLHAQPKLVHYKHGPNLSEDSKDEGDYHGKVIVSYDADTHAYEVWMAGADLTAPILKSE